MLEGRGEGLDGGELKLSRHRGTKPKPTGGAPIRAELRSPSSTRGDGERQRWERLRALGTAVAMRWSPSHLEREIGSGEKAVEEGTARERNVGGGSGRLPTGLHQREKRIERRGYG